jgi:hypothetical protein
MNLARISQTEFARPMDWSAGLQPALRVRSAESRLHVGAPLKAGDNYGLGFLSGARTLLSAKTRQPSSGGQECPRSRSGFMERSKDSPTAGADHEPLRRSGVSVERRHLGVSEKSPALCRDAATGRRFMKRTSVSGPFSFLPLLLLLLCFGAAVGPLTAAVFTEDFANDPSARGWHQFGETTLFHWNSTNGSLDVTWDSSQTNSYFFHPLGTVLTSSDDFSLAFDLRLSDITIGVNPTKRFTFEIAAGLINYPSATNANFFRGSGNNATYHPRNLVELDYFPDSGYGATFAPTVAFTNIPAPFSTAPLAFSDNHPLAISTGDWFHLTMTYVASNRTLRTVATRNGQPFGLPPDNTLADLVLADYMDFRVDTFAVSSYSDGHAGGSVLAHGTLDNVTVVTPEPPVTNLTGCFAGSIWQVQFTSRTNWTYLLERTTDWTAWARVSDSAAGTGLTLTLQETNTAGAGSAFYRVRADRP